MNRRFELKNHRFKQQNTKGKKSNVILKEKGVLLMKKGDVFESSSGYQLMRLKVLLRHEGYESKIEYSGFLPRLVITKVTWKAKIRRIISGKRNDIQR